jgi:soluble lytic murein transglycosylase-like protein
MQTVYKREGGMTHKQNFLTVTFLVLLYSLISLTCLPQDVSITKIIQIESSGNPDAYNPKSGAIGLCQILPQGALADWNNYHPNGQYDELDLYNPEINTLIGEWYINYRIPQMLKYYGIEDTIDNRLISYNFGIGNLKNGKPLPKETQDYLKKYKESK